MAHRFRHRLLWLALAAAGIGMAAVSGITRAQEPPFPSEFLEAYPEDYGKTAAQKQMDEINAYDPGQDAAGQGDAAAPPPAAVPSKKINSLFFSPEEVRDIHLAINTYLKHVNNRQDLTFDEEAFLRRLSGLKTSSPSRYYTYPQFFLDSLVYHKADDWVIWLNGQKITQDTLTEGTQIHVLEIDAGKVKLEWLPPAMERVLEVWNQIPNDETIVDQLRGKVIFTLHPNQTFSSYVMKVLEGKVMPVTVDTALIEKTLSASSISRKEQAKESRASEAPAPPEKTERMEGLPGLIDSYRNLKQESLP